MSRLILVAVPWLTALTIMLISPAFTEGIGYR